MTYIFQLKFSDQLDHLLSKYGSVFNGELGAMKGIEAKIFVKEGAEPKFFKPRTVAYILRAKIEKELTRLQDSGILSPVQFSEWAAPIVPVVKPDGSVRDYKLTVNQVSHLESYRLPRAEDLFSSLSGGTKLDLTQAYLQLPLHTESKK